MADDLNVEALTRAAAQDAELRQGIVAAEDLRAAAASVRALEPAARELEARRARVADLRRQIAALGGAA